jgi:hypothetical protein
MRCSESLISRNRFFSTAWDRFHFAVFTSRLFSQLAPFAVSPRDDQPDCSDSEKRYQASIVSGKQYHRQSSGSKKLSIASLPPTTRLRWPSPWPGLIGHPHRGRKTRPYRVTDRKDVQSLQTVGRPNSGSLSRYAPYNNGPLGCLDLKRLARRFVRRQPSQDCAPTLDGRHKSVYAPNYGTGTGSRRLRRSPAMRLHRRAPPQPGSDPRL